MSASADVAAAPQRSGRLLNQLASTFSVEILGFVAAMAFSVVVTRLLGPAGKGAFAAAMSAVGIAVAVSGAGLAKSLLHYASRHPGDANAYAAAALRMIPAMAIVASLAIAGFLAGDDSRPWQTWVVATGLACATIVGGLLEALRRARREILTANLAHLSQTLGQLALVGLAFVALGLDFRLVLACVLGSWLIRCAVLGRSLRPWPSLRGALDTSRMRDLLVYGVTYQGYAILWVLHTRLVVVLVERWASLDAAGFYSTGANLAQLLWRLPVVVSFVTIPILTSARGEKEAAELTALTCRLLLPLAASVAMGFYLFADPIVALLYEDRFLPSAAVLRIQLPGAVASVVYLALVGHLLARKRLGTLVAVGALGAAANIALNVVWIPTAGADGAALASCVSYTLSFVVALALVVRSDEIPWHRYLLLQRSDFDLVLRRFRRG